MNPLQLLNKLPFNGYKAWIGFTLGAIVLGLIQLGKVDATTGGYLLDAITLWTGVALTHKSLKDAEPSGPHTAVPPTPPLQE